MSHSGRSSSGPTGARIERGEPQRAILERAYRREARMASGEKPVVGVNCFVDPAERDAEPAVLHRVSPEAVVHQRERLAAVRASRHAAAVTDALDALRRAAEGTENLFPHVLEAVRRRATIGEVTRALRQVWGEYKAAPGL